MLSFTEGKWRGGEGSGMYVRKPKEICHLEDLGIDGKKQLID